MTNIAWTDVETTGLDAQECKLLEVAVLITDAQLNVLDESGFQAVVKYSAAEADDMYATARPIVKQMHAASGLWKELYGFNARPLKAIDLDLREYLRFFGKQGEMPVGGNSVRLDMNFMDVHLPKVASFLNHQMRDVTTVAKLAQEWYGIPSFSKSGGHRAMADIRESIDELRYYRERAFKPVFGQINADGSRA